MHPAKTCTPIYLEPQKLRQEALTKLEALEALKQRQQWVDDSALFLNQDGSFSHRVIEETSFKVRTQKASLFMANLVSPIGYKASPKEQRLQISRRRLLVSLLAHAWLWGRPKVLDNQGNLVTFEKRRVLAPQDILGFLDKVRARKVSCTYEEIQKFLVGIPEVLLHEDTSKWNITGVVACLRWDKSHDLNGGPWCSCRLEKDRSPPPYEEVCRTENPNLGVVHRFGHWLLRGNSKAGCKREIKA